MFAPQTGHTSSPEPTTKNTSILTSKALKPFAAAAALARQPHSDEEIAMNIEAE